MSVDGRDVSLPQGWLKLPLEEVCTVIQGQSPPGETYNTVGEGLPFFQGKAEFGELYPTVVKWCSAPTKVAEAGDVLISIRAPVGPTNLCLERACIGRGLASIRPSDGISSKYILYALRASEHELKAKGTGSTFEAIGGRDLRSHRIPIPPTAEHNRIISCVETQFTRIDAGITALHESRAKLNRYRSAVLKAACEGRLVLTEAELALKQA